MKTYIGIDVGKNGAVAAIFPSGHVATHAMPQKDNEIDQDEFSKIIRHINEFDVVLTGVEDVHSIFGSGAKANFQFGRSLGIIEGTLSSLDIEFVKVPPKTWQRVAFEGMEKIKLPGEKEKGKGVYDNKAMALQAVQRLYPNANLLKSTRAKIPHDGIVDALLIAHYLKSKHEN